MTEQNVCNEEILTFPQACAFLNISPATMRNWLKDGRVVGYKIKRDWRFIKSELLTVLREHKQDVSNAKKKET